MQLEPAKSNEPSGDHTENNQSCYQNPDPLHSFFSSFIKEKAHRNTITFLVIEYYHNMLDFYQKRKLRTVMNSRWTQGILGVLAFIMLWNAFERYTIADMMSERRELVEIEAAALHTQKDALEAQVQYLRDERGIEAEMRRQFDIALPGEEVVVILEEEEEESAVQPIEQQPEDDGWWPW